MLSKSSARAAYFWWGGAASSAALLAAVIIMMALSSPPSLSALCQAKESFSYAQLALSNKPAQMEFTQALLKMSTATVDMGNAETGPLRLQQIQVAADMRALADSHQFFLHVTVGKPLSPQSSAGVAAQKLLDDQASPVLQTPAATQKCNVCVTRPHEKICF